MEKAGYIGIESVVAFKSASMGFSYAAAKFWVVFRVSTIISAIVFKQNFNVWSFKLML